MLIKKKQFLMYIRQQFRSYQTYKKSSIIVTFLPGSDHDAYSASKRRKKKRYGFSIKRFQAEFIVML